MGKKGLKSRIKSLEKRIKEHQEKIIAEKAKTYPNEGLISHWD